MPSSAFRLGSFPSLEDLEAVASGRRRAVLTPAALRALAASRRVVESAAAGSRAVYGINTGFGELASTRVAPEKLAALQRNLILSHACGVGEPLSEEEARGLVFLRLNEFCRGFSGVRPRLARWLERLLASGLVPRVPSRGSVGASGDLAPQAHAALAVLGEGRLLRRGREVPARRALAAAGLKPLAPAVKEGLALCNGTQAMQSVGGLALVRAGRVWRAAHLSCAASLDALTGTPDPYAASIQRLKPHPGQAQSAALLRRLLAGSAIRRSHVRGDPRVQDPYSLRCAPQVHGAVKDRLDEARRVVETEMRSATDNPLVIGRRVVSGGNFHGQALAFAFDGAALALTALSGVCERRAFQVTAGTAPRLKPFLARDPGLESGWMIPQYVAAALVSESKGLAHPASADSIPTSAGKEDFVSMGMGAALKLRTVVSHAAQVIAIELCAAAQALEFHRPLRSGRGVERGLSLLRAKIKFNHRDESLSRRLEQARDMILNGDFESVFR